MKLHYCEKNEGESIELIRKLQEFTDNQFRLAISCNKRKLSFCFV